MKNNVSKLNDISLLSTVSNPYTFTLDGNYSTNASIDRNAIASGTVTFPCVKKVVTNDSPNGSYDDIYIGLYGNTTSSTFPHQLRLLCAVNFGIMGGSSSGYVMNVETAYKVNEFEGKTMELTINGIKATLTNYQFSNTSSFSGPCDEMVYFLINNQGKQVTANLVVY